MLCPPFDLAILTWPAIEFSSSTRNISRDHTTHQHPFRLLRFGSGAPGLRGRGMAFLTEADIASRYTERPRNNGDNQLGRQERRVIRQSTPGRHDEPELTIGNH